MLDAKSCGSTLSGTDSDAFEMFPPSQARTSEYLDVKAKGGLNAESFSFWLMSPTNDYHSTGLSQHERVAHIGPKLPQFEILETLVPSIFIYFKNRYFLLYIEVITIRIQHNFSFKNPKNMYIMYVVQNL